MRGRHAEGGNAPGASLSRMLRCAGDGGGCCRGGSRPGQRRRGAQRAISAPTAWQVTEGQGVVVAVIDSGVDPNVSDLAGSVITGPNLTGVNTPPSNAGWGVHGTWMASLIAGHGHAGGGSGIMGVAPDSKVLSIRVVTDKADPGYGQYQQESDSRVQQSLASAIGYATTHGASVISMSLGYGSPSTVVRSALQNALNRGVVVVASSGNSTARPRDDHSVSPRGAALLPDLRPILRFRYSPYKSYGSAPVLASA